MLGKDEVVRLGAIRRDGPSEGAGLPQIAYVAEERMSKPVDEHYIEQLRRIPDFNRAYDVDGMTVDEFSSFGPAAKTLRQFLDADNALDNLVRDIILPAS